MKNKHQILTFIFLIISTCIFSQTNFSNGFNDGYKKGYCQNQGIGCLAPIPPIAPIPNVNENMNSYQDGYNRGFEAGLNAQKNTNTNSKTRQRFSAQKVDLSQNHIYNPYEDQNTLNLALKVAELKSKRINELYEKGLENYNNDNYSDAIYYANEIIKIEPNISKTYALKAMSQLYKGELLNSYNNISKAKQLKYSGEDNIKLINTEIQEYLRNQMVTENYKNVIDFCTNCWYETNLTNYFLAMAYYYNNDIKNAKKYFKKFDFEPSKTYLDAIKENKILPSPFKNQSQNQKKESEDLNEKANQVKIFLESVKNLYENRKYNEAILFIDKEKNILPIDFKEGWKYLHNIRGNCNYFEKNYFEAINDYTISINNSEKINSKTIYYRALCKSEVKDLYGAIEDYDKLIQLELTENGSVDEIATIYNNKAYALTNLKKYNEALPFVKKALELNKSYWYIWDTKGEIEYNLGNYTQCIKDMSEAIKINKDANSLYYRGLAYLKLGKKDLACKDLKSSGEMGKKDAYYEINKYCK